MVVCQFQYLAILSEGIIQANILLTIGQYYIISDTRRPVGKLTSKCCIY